MMDELEVLLKKSCVTFKDLLVLTVWEAVTDFCNCIKRKKAHYCPASGKKIHNKGKNNMKEGDAQESFFSMGSINHRRYAWGRI